MLRRRLITAALAAAAWPTAARPGNAAVPVPLSRVRPGDPAWPSDAAWDRLRQQVGGRLTRLRPPLAACRDDPDGAACHDLFRALKNPYFIGDDPALTQTSGWIDAWTAQPSAYAVAANSAADVAAAVNFARDNAVRLVVKGGGHSYLGTSNAADSLLIWTRAMNRIEVHDDFVPAGCASAPQPAVSIGSGAIWMQAYNEVSTRHGRYVQGGGCVTVGVAGLVLGGGFGSYSKTYGTAAASLLEAEIVTADGAIRIANACTHPDLFWALKGGGGGTFGVATRLTLQTHALPAQIGIAAMTVRATSDAAWRALIGRFIGFYSDRLFNRHWGNVVTLRRTHRLEIGLESAGLDEAECQAIWQPFLRWIADSPDDYTLERPPVIRTAPARRRWDPAFLQQVAPGTLQHDERPNASPDAVFWTANLAEAGHFLHGFESAWLPAALLAPDRREQFVDTLVAANRIWTVELHFQKGLAGAPAAAVAATRDTATHPAVLDAFALAIIAGESPPAFPDLPGHQPDMAAARRDALRIRDAMAELRTVVPVPASYVAESSFFEADWQTSYWGPHYRRLRAIKDTYDPDGLFFVHHGVGSEAWSDDGFTRLTDR